MKSGVLGAALLAALLLAPSPARADNECGTATGLTQIRTCSGTSYPNGIWYSGLAAQGNTYTFRVPGSATTATTVTATGSGGGAGQRSVGVYIHGSTSSPSLVVEVGSSTNVVNIVQGATTSNSATRNNGIYLEMLRQFTTSNIDVRAGVTIGTASAPMRQNGIFMELSTLNPSGARGTYGSAINNAGTIHARLSGIRWKRAHGPETNSTTITNSGAISAGVGNTSATNSNHLLLPHGIAMEFGGTQHTGALTINNSGAITVSGAYNGIFLNYWGGGNVTATNSGAITATASGGMGINLDLNNTYVDNVSLNNSGTINAHAIGIRFARDSASTGTTDFDNSGDITVTGDAGANTDKTFVKGTSVGHAILLPNNGASGAITIDNEGDLSSKNHALFATLINTASTSTVTLTNTGSVTSENGDGIRVEQVGTGALIVESGAAGKTVSGGAFGLYASHGGTAGTVSVTHAAGAVGGRTGILAEVTRASGASDTRATNQPLLDVTWTEGTFAHGTGQAASDTGRFAAASAGRVVALDQTATAQKAARPGQAAGIEARLLSWRHAVTAVAASDDPGAFADNTAQIAAVPTGATAADNAYVAQFRAALENDELAVASGVLTAIDSTATSMDDVTDAEIVAYLRTDNAGRRTLLRNILRHGLSEKEQAVLAALATNNGLTAALDDTDANFGASYKTAVNNLLNRHQVDDLRVAVNAGSIVSRGDGIRAHYATYNSGNGGIEVTIAAGTTVSGGVSGVYLANAGTGLMVAQRYTPGWTSGNGDTEVAVNQITVSGGTTTTTALLDQKVTVSGEVTGGTDAAVRLVGGGGVIVLQNAKVHAGSSGVAVLVDEAKPGLVYVDGEVRGGAGGDAAVYLKGGGSVTIGLNGKVEANGATRAIRGSSDADVPTLVTVAIDSALQYKDDVTGRIAGSVEGVAEVIFREYDSMGAPTATATTVSVTSSGMLNASTLPWQPVTAEPTTTSLSCPTTGRCAVAAPAGAVSERTGVYAVVAEASAMGATRAATQPAIDVTWTGTFAHGAGSDDTGRFTAASPVAVVAYDQTAAAQQTVRYDRAAGIEARLLSWREAVTVVAAGDAPTAFANNAAQLTAVPTGATAADNDYVARFRAALGNAEVDATAVIAAIDSTATTVADLTDAEIVAYLRTDDAGIRVLLRDLLAQGLSEKEKAVLIAVAAGNTATLATALDDTDAAFSASYKTAVNALLDRHHVDDIGVAVNGGSIDSRGDGIRAYYATPHANNGAISVSVATGATVEGAQAGVWVANAGDDIDVSVSGGVTGGTDGIYATNAGENINVILAAGASVTGTEAGIHVADAGDDDDISVSVSGSVTGGTDGIYATNAGGIGVTIAAGATVTGAEAGIHVADAGEGLMVARKYTPGWQQAQAQNGEDLVAAEYVTVASGVTTTTALLDQLVTVSGTVTGGTDAAVHLEGGGGVLVMDGGEVRAGSSGVAILVNDPGPALLHIDGTVRGGAGGAAAVRLTGGGSVTVGLNGRVEANGATAAIDGGSAGAPRVEVVLATDGMIQHRGQATAAVNARVDGSFANVDNVRIREYQNSVLTGYSMALTVASNGQVDVSGLPLPPCPAGQVRGSDGVCRTPPPPACPEGQVRGSDGQCRTPPPPACPEGQVRGSDGQCRTPPPPACPEGQVRGSDGQCRTPPPPACPEGQVRGSDGQCRTPPPPACPAGQVRGDDGQCRTPPPTACPADQVRGSDGVCRTPAPAPTTPCLPGQVRGDDGQCRTPTTPTPGQPGEPGGGGEPLGFCEQRVQAGTHGRCHSTPDDGGGIDAVIAAGPTVTGSEAGVYAAHATPGDANGGIRVTIARGASVTSAGTGVSVANAGTGLRIQKRYAPLAIRNLAGNKALGEDALVAMGDLNEAGDAIARPWRNQLVTVYGTVTGGTGAAVYLPGGGAVLVMEGGKVHAGSSGVAILVNDPGPAHAYIDGEVKGDAGGAAAMHLTGGGSVVVGPNGSVQANAATNAIQGGGSAATGVEVVLVKPAGTTIYREDVMDRVEGPLADVDEIRIREEDRNGVPTGYSSMALTVASNGQVDVSVLPPRPTDPPDPGTGPGQPRQPRPPVGPLYSFSCQDAMDGRCRLYEALPSMLLALNGLPSYAERMSAARDGNGAWARVETARGEWEAKKATMRAGGGKLAYDHRRSTGQAGVEFLAGEQGRVGLSVHALRGKAEMANVGEVQLDGIGLGASATWLAGELYLDAQAALTWYYADVESYTHGKLLKEDVSAMGYGLGVDVGHRVSMGGVLVTPRAGLAWSKVDPDTFVDMEKMPGDPSMRARVSVEDAGSMKGRVGVLLETEMGMGARSGRLFGSLDVEQEFTDETRVRVGEDVLKTELRPTALRLGLGGLFRVDEHVTVRATTGYHASGSNATGYSGGLELRVQF